MKISTILTKYMVFVIVTSAIVSLGGIIVYGSFPEFLGLQSGQLLGPAMIYYGSALLIAILAVSVRESYKLLAWMVCFFASILYSLLLKNINPDYKSYLLFIPIMIYFGINILILEYVFFNKKFTQYRTAFYAVVSALIFTLAFRLLYLLIKVPPEFNFWGSRYISSAFLNIFIGFALSMSDYILLKMYAPLTMARREPEEEDDIDNDEPLDE